MNRLLGTFTVLLALTLPSLAQDTGSRQSNDQVAVPGQACSAAGNFSSCQHGWAGCDRSKLTSSESAEMAAIDHQRNVSNCREGLKSCDRTKLGDAERTALSAELLLSQSRTDTATSLIAVYKALGAGWSVSESDGAATARR